MGNCISNNAICDESNIRCEIVVDDDNKTYFITSDYSYKNNINQETYI